MAELGDALSKRELDVLLCVARGLSNKEIALDLSISENTVKVHLRRIFTKLGVSSRTEAATVGIQQGHVVVEEDVIVKAEEAKPVATAVSETPPVVPPMPVAEPSLVAVTTTPMTTPSPRFVIPSVVWGGVLFLLLGSVALFIWRSNSGNETVDAAPFVVEPIADTRWFISRQLPQARAYMAVAAIGLDVYRIGGETPAGEVVGEVAIYDTTQALWREGATKLTAVSQTTAAVLFGEIYVPGGRLSNGQATDVVEVYSPANNAWRPAAPLPQPISGGLAISDGAFLYLFGGWNGFEYLDTAYVYDPNRDSWDTLPSLVQPRAFAGGALLTGQILVVGGRDEQGELDSCELYAPDAAEWLVCPSMLLSRASMGTAVLLNKLYVIGGGGGGQVTFSEFYDPNSQTWQIVDTPMLTAVPDWMGAGVINVESRIYAFGGKQGQTFIDGNYIYRPLVYQTFIPAASTGE